jgi:hypothetical protein
MCVWTGECRASKKRKFNSYELFEKHFKREHSAKPKVLKDLSRQEVAVARMEAELPRQRRLLSDMRAHLDALKASAPVVQLNIDGEEKNDPLKFWHAC